MNSRHSIIAAVMLTTLALVGCGGDPRTPGPITGLAVAEQYGQPPALSAKVLIRATEPNGDSTTFTLYLWRAADGRTRLLLTKIDVDVLHLLVEADGAFSAWAPRGQRRARGDLNDQALPVVISDLRLLIADLCEGPLPSRIATTTGSHGNVLVGNDDTLRLTATIDPLSGTVSEKLYHRRDGSLAYQLRYSDLRTYDDYQRAAKVQVITSDGSTTTAWLKDFSSLGDVSTERMAFAPPATTAATTLSDLLDHLDQ